MWTRKELKDKAKVSFRVNYWKSVLSALVLAMLIGGMSVYSSFSSFPTMLSPSVTSSNGTSDNVNVQVKDGKVFVDVDDEKGGKVHVDLDADDLDDLDDVLSNIDIDDEEINHVVAIAAPGIVLLGISTMLIMLSVIALVIALYMFILSPLEVGAQRFFVRNLNQRAEIKELAFGYDNNYKENVKTLFLRWLFIFLWSLLLIIPGIYKAYEYRMIPYLLAEDPTMTKDRAFAESRRMMDGQKWNAFVLDLSFLGWNILSAMTLGILGAFYVTPYQTQTNAALYEKLRYGLPAPEQAAQSVPVAPVPGTAAQAPAQVITSASQPPVPPFAQVGAQPAGGFAPATAQPEAGPESTIQQSVVEADIVKPLSEADVDPTIPMLKPEATAPLPEAGIDATASLPTGEENNAKPDSPEA